MMPQQNQQLIYNENRLSVREDVNAEIILQQSGSTAFRAIMLDLSMTGFKITSRRNLDAAKPVFLRMPGIPILRARIRWDGFLDYGCQFSRPLEPGMMESMLRRLRG